MAIPKGVGSWLVIVVLVSLLAATGFVVYRGLTVGDVTVPTPGYVAMALGVIFSLIIGFGLMALIFYSSRRGYDEPPVLIKEPETDSDDPPKGLDAP